MEIMPAVLVDSAEELTVQLKKLLPHFNSLQIDIADGLFVPNKTLDVDQIIVGLNQEASKLENDLNVDFDLMVNDYKVVVSKLPNLNSKVKVNNLFLRPKTISKEDSVAVQKLGFNIGLAIDPDVSVETIQQQFKLTNVPVIQIMTVVPGAQGQSFITDALDKIEQFRNAGYRNKLYLDGGINEQTLPVILSKQFRPDVLCVGSYFSKSDNVGERLTSLKKLLGEN